MRDILTDPPSREVLGRIAKATSGGTREMVTTRTDSAEYQQHIGGKQLGDEQLLDLLANIPNLLRKPLLTDGTRALQGVDDPTLLKSFVEAKA